MQTYVLHSLYPVILINLRHLNAICFLLLQLPLMLVLQHRCAVDVPDNEVIGAMFHYFEHERHEFEILHGEDGDLIPPVWCFSTTF